VNDGKFRLSWRMNSPKYRGDACYCPCCGNSFSEFADFRFYQKYHNEAMFPKGTRKVICPCCGSYPRHRIICDCFEKNGWPAPGSKVLLFAPLYNMKLWFRRKGFEYTSADLFDRTADLKIDIQKTGLPDGGYDLISCDHVLEHVPDFGLTLRELYRIIKPGGRLEVTVPLDPSLEGMYEDTTVTDPVERAEKFGQFDHFRVFGRDFGELLHKAGFEVEAYDGDTCDRKMGTVTAPSVYDYNKVFICTKPVKGI